MSCAMYFICLHIYFSIRLIVVSKTPTLAPTETQHGCQNDYAADRVEPCVEPELESVSSLPMDSPCVSRVSPSVSHLPKEYRIPKIKHPIKEMELEPMKEVNRIFSGQVTLLY